MNPLKLIPSDGWPTTIAPPPTFYHCTPIGSTGILDSAKID